MKSKKKTLPNCQNLLQIVRVIPMAWFYTNISCGFLREVGVGKLCIENKCVKRKMRIRLLIKQTEIMPQNYQPPVT